MPPAVASQKSEWGIELSCWPVKKIWWDLTTRSSDAGNRPATTASACVKRVQYSSHSGANLGTIIHSPLGSVSIQCDYRDRLDVPQSFVTTLDDILGPRGFIPYQDKVINEFPPRSMVKDILCTPKTVEIWQKTDDIPSLNARLCQP